MFPIIVGGTERKTKRETVSQKERRGKERRGKEKGLDGYIEIVSVLKSKQSR